jgi:hypothetical protein
MVESKICFDIAGGACIKSSMQTEDDPFGIWMNKIKDLEGIKR